MIMLIVEIALVGLLVWVVRTLIPMDAKFQQIIYVIAVVVCVFLVLSAFGLVPAGMHMRNP